MKKLIVQVVISALIVTTLAGCSKDTAGTTPPPATEQQAQSDGAKSKGVEVEKEIFDVKLTLPASMFQGQDLETVKKNALAEGIHEVIINGDGSLTYIMSKKQHKKMLDETTRSITESLDEFMSDEDMKAIFKEISYNKDYTELTAKVDPGQYNSWSEANLLGFKILGMMYQRFSGEGNGKIAIKTNIIDFTNGSTIRESVYPVE